MLTLLFICFVPQKEKAAEDEPELDPDIAATMGFGGFGSSKKWLCKMIRVSVVIASAALVKLSFVLFQLLRVYKFASVSSWCKM